MKKEYVAAEMEIVKLNCADIITTSTNENGGSSLSEGDNTTSFLGNN